MKIDKIIYDGLEKGDQISIAETRKVTDLLEKSKKFEEFIIYLRKKYKIPENGYSVENRKHGMEVIFTDESLMDKFFEESMVITSDLELPYYWWSSIAHFAWYNIFFTPEKEALSIVENPRDSAHFGSISIHITERISKNELHHLIDQKWEQIEEALKSVNKARGHKMARSSLAKRIVSMRDIDKMKFGDIAESLQKENVNNELFDILNEDYIRILYHRWKSIKP